MDNAVGIASILLVIAAPGWGISRVIAIRKARANDHEVGEETPGQRIAWCIIVILLAVIVGAITILNPVLIGESHNFSSLRTALTGLLTQSVGASSGQRAFAFVQSFGVAALVGVVAWLAIRSGNQITRTAIATYGVTADYAGEEPTGK
ncbi:hypothetical protein [Timonella senegalensis]|uniref:hypothetical protein n=1 Tax=Timonella senegalensis TaxID=1465825 RepID=UPI0003012FBD|nr:hypothetical protein [Timonella senegalensis]